jgi:hypothetical protein
MQNILREEAYMSKLGFLRKLEDKNAKDEELAEEATKNKECLQELINGITSQQAKIKFRSAKILRIISEKNPKSLYDEWEFFARLLDSKNTILKWNAMDIIANLTRVDAKNRFDELFKKFYGYLYDGSLITAGHVGGNSGTIALAKPKLKDRITKELLKVERISLPTEECRNILIGQTIDTFSVFYDKISDKDEVAAFVKRQLNNTRRSTKAKAEKFLKKFEQQ